MMLRKIKSIVMVLFLAISFSAIEARANLLEPDLSTMLSLRDTYGFGLVYSWPAANPCPNDTINWGGVGCSGGRVISFNLGCASRFLSADLPQVISSLAYMQEISIRGCDVRGGYALRPGEQPVLSTIRLDINRINGTLNDFFPEGISPAQFPQLGLLNLATNEISGPIPAGLMEFSSSTTFILNVNKLSGTLPPTRISTGSLPRFDISQNALEGVLPNYLACAGGPTCKIDYNKFDVVNTPPGMTNFSWRATQTVPPQNVQAQASGAGTANITWTPIEYQAHGGYYEVLSSQTAGGPYISRGTTVNSGAKTATGLTVSGLPAGTNYFVVRTFTPPAFTYPAGTGSSINSRNDLMSVNSTEVSASVAASRIVTKTADTNDGVCDADCSLREAVAAANSGDSITFAEPLFNYPQTVALTLGQITIPSNKSLSITGRGAQLTAVSGNNQSRVFEINTGSALKLENLTVTGGNTSTYGGGINNHGTLTLNGAVVSGNSATLGSGGINSDNDSILFINNSTVGGNVSNANAGGIQLFYAANVSIINSTVSGNTANGFGAGLNVDFSPVQLVNVTITNNHAGNNNGGVSNFNGTVSARNTIIAGNTAANGTHDFSGTLTSQSYNLIGDTTGATITGVAQGNILDQNALLAPLGFYGGQTMTHTLLSGSPAINGARYPTNSPAADQRKAGRVGYLDIGAVEVSNAINGGNFRAAIPAVGTQNVPYYFVITPNNGAINYTLTSGNLPNGVNLTTNIAPNAVVALTGTPTQTGTFNFSLTASDGVNTNVTDYQMEVLAPTAAGVSVSGRVLVGKNGLQNAIVTMTDMNGNTRSYRTGSFGYFVFDDVEVGQTYIFQVQSKRFQFAPQVVTINEDLTELIFTVQEQ